MANIRPWSYFVQKGKVMYGWGFNLIKVLKEGTV